jgi:hypothetical protein
MLVTSLGEFCTAVTSRLNKQARTHGRAYDIVNDQPAAEGRGQPAAKGTTSQQPRVATSPQPGEAASPQPKARPAQAT